MTRWRPIGLLMALLLLPAADALADSVTTTDNLTVFGRVLRMDDEQVVLQARSSAGEKELKIPRSVARRIEFNATTFNTGGPPSVGLRPGDEGATPLIVPESAGPSVLMLRGGDRRSCDTLSIAARDVNCDKKTFDRDTVIRIQLRGN